MYTASIVVATRDRSHLLEQLLAQLAKSAAMCQDQVRASLTLVDDSTSRTSQTRNAQLLETIALGIPANYVARESQLSTARLLFGGADTGCFIRPLGASAWNVASSRNTGIIHVVTSGRGDDCTLFLDDDIDVAGGNQRWLAQLTSECVLQGGIIGVRLGGMPDESRLDRLRRHLEEAQSTQQILRTERRHAYPISGGCMMVGRDVMMDTPFPFLYNEDWFFCLESSALGYEVDTSLVTGIEHSATEYVLELGKLLSEAEGQIAYRALCKAPTPERFLEWIPENATVWEECRSDYVSEISEVLALCSLVNEADMGTEQILNELRSAVLGLQPSLRQFRERPGVRARWSRILAAW